MRLEFLVREHAHPFGGQGFLNKSADEEQAIPKEPFLPIFSPARPCMGTPGKNPNSVTYVISRGKIHHGDRLLFKVVRKQGTS